MIVFYLLPLLCAEVFGVPRPAIYALDPMSDMLYELDSENPQQALAQMTAGRSVPVLTFLEMDDDTPKHREELPSKEEEESSVEDETEEIKKIFDDVIAGLQDTRKKIEKSGIDKHISLDVETSIKDLKKLKKSLPGEPKMGQISILRKSISISAGKGKPVHKSKNSATVAPSTNVEMSTKAPPSSEKPTYEEKPFSLFPSELAKYESESKKLGDTSKASFQKTTWKSSSLV